MKLNRLTLQYFTFESFQVLDKLDRILFNYATEAMLQAYAPYSNFRVGAALRLNSGEIITGNNQENSAYPSGLCAERVVLFYASAKYPNLIIESLAIIAQSNDLAEDFIVTPCGACRQVLIESQFRQNKDIRVLMASTTGKGLIFNSVDLLLPFSFKLPK